PRPPVSSPVAPLMRLPCTFDHVIHAVRVRATCRRYSDRNQLSIPYRSARLELGQSPAQQTALGVVADELERAVVGAARIRLAAEAQQQLGACGMKVVE